MYWLLWFPVQHQLQQKAFRSVTKSRGMERWKVKPLGLILYSVDPGLKPGTGDWRTQPALLTFLNYELRVIWRSRSVITP
ncbi:unnamed protein product [Boreogadus saida]